MTLSVYFLVVSERSEVAVSSFVVWSGGMVRCVGYLVRSSSRVGSCRVASTAMNIVLIVAGSQVLVEHGSISAVKRILLTVRVTEVINLQS